MPLWQVHGCNVNGDRFQNMNIMYDRTPDECPQCHSKITPDSIPGGFAKSNWVELFFRCTSLKCQRSFVARYASQKPTNSPIDHGQYSFTYSIPVEPVPVIVPDEITALSPDFVRILTQAHTAEGHNLDEVAGPGYRKALEFLIKDYAISLQTVEDAKDEIKKIQLGNVIKNYLSGDRLEVVSKRAAWLGNDETHYERRWIGKDLEDLKKLIWAVQHFISMEILVKNLPVDMPDPKTATP